MTRSQLRATKGMQLTANAAQMSLRDLRLRPLRPVIETPAAGNQPSPLEQALLQFIDDQP